MFFNKKGVKRVFFEKVWTQWDPQSQRVRNLNLQDAPAESALLVRKLGSGGDPGDWFCVRHPWVFDPREEFTRGVQDYQLPPGGCSDVYEFRQENP